MVDLLGRAAPEKGAPSSVRRPAMQMRACNIGTFRTRVFFVLALCVLAFLYASRRGEYDPHTMPLEGEEDGTTDTHPPHVLLYRAIGSDVYPPHDKGYHVRTVRSILHEEKLQPGFVRRWLLWHIADPNVEQEVIDLLKQHGEKYTRAPFNLSQYALRCPVEEAMVKVDDLNRLPDTTQIDKAQLLDYYREKAGYVFTAVNDAEMYNLMVEDGFANSHTSYVIPAPLQATYTPGAIAGLKEVVVGDAPSHLVVAVMNFAARAKTSVDVVVGFKRDTQIRFDESVRQLRASTDHLLSRLGFDGAQGKMPSPSVVGVLRGAQALAWSGGMPAKTEDMLKGAMSTVSSLDQRTMRELVGYKAQRLLWYDEAALAREKNLYRTKTGPDSLQTLVSELLSMADTGLNVGPFSVVHKLETPPSGDKHDYYTPAPYYWPDPKGAHLPYIVDDGNRVPGTGLYDEESEKFDRSRLASFMGNTTALALAWYFSEDSRYAERGALFVKTWFLDPATCMNPNMKFAQLRRNHRKDIESGGFQSGVIETKDFYFFLDAVRLLHQSGVLSERDFAGVQKWVGEFLRYVLEERQGKNERKSANNHGTYYDLQVAALAAFMDDPVLFRSTVERSRGRMLAQFASDGSLPDEMRRPTQLHYMLFSLQGWYTLARVAQRAGVGLWDYKPRADSDPHPTLRRSAVFTVPYFNSTWTHHQTQEEDMERMLPLYHMARYAYPDLKVVNRPEKEIYATKPRFNEHDGICLFWNIGLLPNGAD